MIIIKDGKVDPDFLASLNRKNNIVICIPPTETNIVTESDTFSDTFGISLPRDLNLSENDIIRISTNCLSTNIKPNIKISFPAGLKIQFSDYVEDIKQNIFLKNYKSFNINKVFTPIQDPIFKQQDEHIKHSELSHYLLTDMMFILYMDTIRMREVGLPMIIKKETQITDFYFTWYVQTKRDMPQIEEIYLISDLHVYEDFINIF